MKWQDIGSAAVVHSWRITQLAAIRGEPRAQVELVTPVLPPQQGIYTALALVSSGGVDPAHAS